VNDAASKEQRWSQRVNGVQKAVYHLRGALSYISEVAAASMKFACLSYFVVIPETWEATAFHSPSRLIKTLLELYLVVYEPLASLPLTSPNPETIAGPFSKTSSRVISKLMWNNSDGSFHIS